MRLPVRRHYAMLAESKLPVLPVSVEQRGSVPFSFVAHTVTRRLIFIWPPRDAGEEVSVVSDWRRLNRHPNAEHGGARQRAYRAAVLRFSVFCSHSHLIVGCDCSLALVLGVLWIKFSPRKFGVGKVAILDRPLEQAYRLFS